MIDMRNAGPVKAALARIEEGDPTRAIVRAALLLMKAGTGRRRLSAMKRARELVGKEIGLLEMSAEAAREIIHEQSSIVDFEPERALAALPKLLPTAEDRRMFLELFDRLEGSMEANEEQIALLGDIRRLLSEAGAGGEGQPPPAPVAESAPAKRRPPVRSPAATRRPGSRQRARAS
jgi:hypothetical protein